MDPSMIKDLISSVGFPILCCGLLFWQQNKTMADFSSKMENNMGELTKSVNDNTEATTKLVATVEVLAKVGDANG